MSRGVTPVPDPDLSSDGAFDHARHDERTRKTICGAILAVWVSQHPARNWRPWSAVDRKPFF